MTSPMDDNLEFQLSQYLDGQLPPAEAARLQQRLAEDSNLRDELRLYQSLERRLDALAADGPSEIDFRAQRQNILAALERKSLLTVRRRPLVFRPVFITSFASAIAAAVLLLWGLGPLLTHATHAPAPQSAAQITVALLPQAPPAGPTQAVIELRPMALGELPVDVGHQELAQSDMPAGTVLMSVGQTVAADAPQMPFMTY